MIGQILEIPEVTTLQPERLLNFMNFLSLWFNLSDNSENHCFFLCFSHSLSSHPLLLPLPSPSFIHFLSSIFWLYLRSFLKSLTFCSFLPLKAHFKVSSEVKKKCTYSMWKPSKEKAVNILSWIFAVSIVFYVFNISSDNKFCTPKCSWTWNIFPLTAG